MSLQDDVFDVDYDIRNDKVSERTVEAWDKIVESLWGYENDLEILQGIVNEQKHALAMLMKLKEEI